MKKTSALLITAIFLAQNPIFVYAAESVLVSPVRVSAESVYITTNKPVKYKAFMSAKPPKLIVELENSRMETLQEIPVNGTFIKTVRTGQYKTAPVSISRVVLDLTQKAVYDITQKGNEMVVVIGGKFRAQKPEPETAKTAAPKAAAPAEEDVKVIQPTSPAKTAPEPAVLPGAEKAKVIKSGLPVRSAVAPVAAPAADTAKAVKSVSPAKAPDAAPAEEKAKAAKPEPPVKFSVMADAQPAPENVKVIKPSSHARPAAAAAQPAVKPADRSGESASLLLPKRSASSSSRVSRNIMDNLPTEPVNLDYSGADVRDIINMLAAKAGINILFSDDVTGNTSINLNKVPFDEAFRTILSVNGLAAQQVGDNILRIATPQTLLAEQKKAFLQTRVFFLNYSRASDVKVQLDAVAAAEGSNAKCTIDDANNALIATDSALGLENTARLIRSLDRVPKQVVIEAKLVEVSLDNSLDYGIQWSGYGEKNGTFVGAGNSLASIGSSANGTTSNIIPGYVNGSLTGATAAPLAAADRTNTNGLGGTGVSLPADIIYGALRMGKVASNYILDATITAAAKKGKAKVLSDPKVATLNNKEATINITSQTPYTTSQTTQATPPVTTTSVIYLETGIVLRVTPSITSDGRISMKINPKVSQINSSIPALQSGAPGVDTRSADTNVIVRDGETIVIGGLIHDTQSEVIYKVPLLGDIPLLGYLFRKKSMSRSRMELIIFVTPKIIEG